MVEFDIQAQDIGQDHGLTFAVEADVEVGDEVTDTLPNGKTKTIRLRELQVRQNPFGGRSRLDHTSAKHDEISARAPLRQPTPISLPGLHQLISAASGSQIVSHHYDDAIFNAFKAVEDRVKVLSGQTEIGKRLMTAVFNEQNPLLDITSDASDASQKADEREGYKFLFMGGAQALRNTRGHGPSLHAGEHEAMEMLATTSLLMGALARLSGGQQW